MGKGKRSKERNAEEVLKNPATVSNNRTAILTKVALIVIAVVLVATLLLVSVLQSGIPLRSNTVYETENFKVTGTMMQYLFNSQYQGFMSSYYQYANYFGINSALSIRDQKFDPTNSFVSMLMGLSDEYKDFKGTWFDYFWSVTEDQVKKTLVFCEAAHAAGVKLDDEDKKEIEDTIDAMYEQMDQVNEEYRAYYEEHYNQPNFVYFKGIKAYLTATYGEGVNVSDVRKTLELVQLSSKFYDSEAEKILEDIKNDDEAVNKYYNDHISDYYKADYLDYTFTVSYTAPKDEKDATAVWSKYILDINKALDHAKALSECESEEEFKTYMINYWFDDLWQTQYDKTISELKKKDNEDKTGKVLTDEDIPDKDIINEKKEKARADIIDALLNEKKAEDFEASGDTAFDGAIDAIRENLFTTLSGSSYYASLEKTRAEYDDSTDEGKWLFNENRYAGDASYFPSHEATFVGGENVEEEGDAAAQAEETNEETGTETNPDTDEETPEEEIKYNWELDLDRKEADDAKFTVNARFVLKSRYVIEDLVREFGHILVTKDKQGTEEKAKELAEKLLKQLQDGKLSRETFETLAKENTEDSGVFYDEVKPGDMVEEMNDWLFNEARKEGDIEIVKTDFGYHVVYLTKIHDKKAYFIEARTDYYNDEVEAWVEKNEKTHAVNYKGDFAKNNINIAMF